MTYPPGTILQRMHVRRRLRRLPPGTFIDVGAGGGHISGVLLDLGWTGVGYELSEESCANLRQAFRRPIAEGRYQVVQGDWLSSAPVTPPADVVVSSMVLEHLDEQGEQLYLEQCHKWLVPGGTGMLLVPGSPAHWGIEDVIAGHHRRYTRERLLMILHRAGMTVSAIDGLTYPLSNLLLPVSDHLVARAEAGLAGCSLQERTEASGHRAVHGKTSFPGWSRVVLNEFSLAPFELLQRLFSRSPSAMILFAEFRPAPPSTGG